VTVGGEIDFFKEPFCSLDIFSRVPTANTEGEKDVVPYGFRREKTVILKNETKSMVAKVGGVDVKEVEEFFPFPENLSTRGFLETSNKRQKGGFAAS